MSKFICNCCDEELESINYSMKIGSNGEMMYFDKNTKKNFQCSKGNLLKPADNSFKGVPMLNSFNSLSSQEKQKVLLKRSHQDFKKNVREQKEEMNKKAIENFKNI